MSRKINLNQKLLEELLTIQIRAETLMLERVAKRIKRNIDTPGWNEQKLKDIQTLRMEIEAILNDTNKLTTAKVSEGLYNTYIKASKDVSKSLGMPDNIMKDMVPYHLQRVILETQQLITGTSFNILRNTMDVYRSVISETSTGVLTGTETRRQSAQRALNHFAEKGVSGFTDKLGRNWELASYVEMAIRTSNMRASLQGHVDRSLELGQDLMVVSNHSVTCPLCAPWGGAVISITGKTPNYPTLAMAQSAGLFHPNCKHTLSVYFPDVEGNQEMLEDNEDGWDEEKYKATQVQRYNERKIREWRRIESVALDDTQRERAHGKVIEWRNRQSAHVKEWDLKRRPQREQIKKAI